MPRSIDRYFAGLSRNTFLLAARELGRRYFDGDALSRPARLSDADAESNRQHCGMSAS